VCDEGQTVQKRSVTQRFCTQFVQISMTIIALSDALLQRLTPKYGQILRDKMLCGFCIKLGKRSHSFLVSTSAGGKQVRIYLGRWPLLSVDEAREIALPILRSCRAGQMPGKVMKGKIPTIWEALPSYAKAKGIQPSSLKRYESIIRIHFSEWKDSSVMARGEAAFAEYCQKFSRSTGNAVVDVGRGLISSLIKYLNAVYGLSIISPFDKLAAAGLMPEHARPRERKLQESDLPSWYKAVKTLPEKQHDYLMLVAFTGLRRDECKYIKSENVDWDAGLLHIPKTKNGDPHALFVTPRMQEILMRRCAGLSPSDELFSGVSAEHVADMAHRAGAPQFMLHDLRKLLATIGEKQGYSDTVLRRILNHRAKRSDTLHRHYVSLTAKDVAIAFAAIQDALFNLMEIPACAEYVIPEN
jgi:integrase